jgi:hypothetical protein
MTNNIHFKGLNEAIEAKNQEVNIGPATAVGGLWKGITAIAAGVAYAFVLVLQVLRFIDANTGKAASPTEAARSAKRTFNTYLTENTLSIYKEQIIRLKRREAAAIRAIGSAKDEEQKRKFMAELENVKEELEDLKHKILKHKSMLEA